MSERDALMEALNEAYLLGESSGERLAQGHRVLNVDEKLREIKERYFF